MRIDLSKVTSQYEKIILAYFDNPWYGPLVILIMSRNKKASLAIQDETTCTCYVFKVEPTQSKGLQ